MNHKHISSNEGNSLSESSLLAELAGEATNKLRAMQSEAQNLQARTQRLDAALSRIFQFFHPFSKHVNNIAPTIPRQYNLDAQTVYAALAWQDAIVDSRKQDISDVALMDYVSFRVRMVAAEPVTVTRRWNQLDILKKELNISGLRALDDLDMLLRSKSQQDTFSARLAPDFQVKIIFQGNYNEGLIDIRGNNVDGFGVASFKLSPENVTAELLDEIGRFLIGRTEALPLSLIRTR